MIRRALLVVFALIIVTFASVALCYPWLIPMTMKKEPLEYAVPILHLIGDPEARDMDITAVHFDSGPRDHPDDDNRQRITDIKQNELKKHLNTIIYIGFNGHALSKSGKDFGCLIGQYQLHAIGDLYHVNTHKWTYQLLSRVVDFSPIISTEHGSMNDQPYLYDGYLFDIRSGEIQNHTCTVKTPQGETDLSRISAETKITAKFP